MYNFMTYQAWFYFVSSCRCDTEGKALGCLCFVFDALSYPSLCRPLPALGGMWDISECVARNFVAVEAAYCCLPEEKYESDMCVCGGCCIVGRKGIICRSVVVLQDCCVLFGITR